MTLTDPIPASQLSVLLFTDLLNSSKLKKQLGDRAYAEQVAAPHNRLFRELLQTFPGAVINNYMGDGYLVMFPRVSDAVNFALLFHQRLDKAAQSGPMPATRIGIYVGELITLDDGSIAGHAADMCARLMSLGGGRQTLLTRHVFDDARQHVRVHPALPDGAETTSPPELGWQAHGLYEFKGKEDDPLEVFEVGAIGFAPLQAPPDSEKVKRKLNADVETTYGLRSSNTAFRWHYFAYFAATVVIIGTMLFFSPFNRGIAEEDKSSPTKTTNIKEPSDAKRSQTDRRVRQVRGSPFLPARDRDRGVQSEVVSSLGTPDFSLFEILEDDIVWDMRGFKQLAPTDPPFSSCVILRRKMTFTKISDVNEIRFEARTSGTDVIMKSVSHPKEFIEYITESKKITGAEVMKVRQIAIDISKIPVGVKTSVEIESAFWDSLQLPQDRWIGAMGYSASDLISFLVVFPEDRMPNGWRLLSSQNRHVKPQPFNKECTFWQSQNEKYIFWEIPFVETDRVYRIEWDW